MTIPTPIQTTPTLFPIDTDGRGNVFQVIAMAGGVDLVVRAESVRREKSGTFARVVWETGEGDYLIHSAFNIDLDEARVRLITRLHSKLSPSVAKAYPKNELQNDFDVFCASVPVALASGEMGEWLEPATERTQPVMLCPWVIKGGGCILFGPPKTGKTWAGLMIGMSVQYGIERLFPVQPTNVLYVNLERGKEQMQQRLLAVQDALGFKATRGLLFLNRRGHSLADVELAIAAMIVKHKIGLVIVDSLSRAGVGDLTKNDAMNAAMDLLNRVCQGGVSWLLIGHTPRMNGAKEDDLGHVYGSMMADAAADALVRLVGEDKKIPGGGKRLGLGFVMAAPANDFEDPGQIIVSLEFERGKGLVSLDPAMEGDFPIIEGAERVPARERMIAHLLDVGEDTATHLAEILNVSRQTCIKLLRSDDRIIGPEKRGRDAYYKIKADRPEPSGWADERPNSRLDL